MKKSILICLLFVSTFVSTSTLISNKAQAEDVGSLKTVLVINAIINQEHKQELQEYLSQMMKIFRSNGGIPLGRYKTIERVKGLQTPEMIAMISFENREVIKEMLEGKEYKSLSKLRERVFCDLKIVICTELN